MSEQKTTPGKKRYASLAHGCFKKFSPCRLDSFLRCWGAHLVGRLRISARNQIGLRKGSSRPKHEVPRRGGDPHGRAEPFCPWRQKHWRSGDREFFCSSLRSRFEKKNGSRPLCA